MSRKAKVRMKLTPSQFTEKFLYLSGAPFSFSGYEHMRDVYDIDAKEVVLKTSRQVSKSTTLANLMLSRSAMNPYFNQLYVSPSVDQTKVFSNDRLAPIIEGSPLISTCYVDGSVQQNVFTKKLKNRSIMYLRYALLSPDRLRGLSTDVNYFDEVQDQNIDVISVINKAQMRSMVKKQVYSGTPKRTKGALASLWYRSTMYEWFVRCEGCNRWNFLDDKNIGLNGVICRHCGKYLNTQLGQWVATGDPDSRTKGFRVSILMFDKAPWIDWQDDVIDERKHASSDALFFNEVLGLEYDSGVSPVTEADIRKCCTGGPMLFDPDNVTLSSRVALGLDYGPVNSSKSKTVLTGLRALPNGNPQVLFCKKYIGNESDYAFIHRDVPRQFFRWHSTLIGADAGLGDGPNAEIRRGIKDTRRLIAFRYSGTQKAKTKWNAESNSYIINRNVVMTEFFQSIKNQQIVFPRWEDFQPFADDILSVYIDYDANANNYKYVNSDPDDSLHSIIFGSMALKLASYQDRINAY